MTLSLDGEPRSTSHIYKYTCRGGYVKGYMSEDGKKLKQSYQWQAKVQWGRKVPLSKPLQVCLTIHFGTKRKSDADNFSKIVLDSLTTIAWHDDSQIQELTIIKAYDKARPRIVVNINELP